MSSNSEKRYAIISVTDPTNLDKLKSLTDRGWTFLASGGTGKKLTALGIPWMPVSEYTGEEELFEGLVKTIHPRIAGGIMYNRANPAHVKTAAEKGIAQIDLVIVNFYDFDKNPGVDQIDIGGPSMARAAAKRAGHATVVIDPMRYEEVVVKIVTQGDTDPDLRLDLAEDVLRKTGGGDLAAAGWLRVQRIDGVNPYLKPSEH